MRFDLRDGAPPSYLDAGRRRACRQDLTSARRRVLRAERRRFPVDPTAAVILADHVVGLPLVRSVSAR
ncbi:MAG TPA: hypothetical protein VNM43_11300 [Dehalococcoidia bacterium]|nr:hypothetical protein [Dehalococcoidia bacterium]